MKKYVPPSGADPGETTIFVYDAAGKLAPSTPAPRRGHPSSGRRGAEYSTGVADAADAKVAYLTADHLGSPRINTDRDGKVTARHDYHPYGEEIVTAQRTSHAEYTPDSVRKQFTGYERDGETDLDFAEARMYSQRLGRFSSVDPYDVIVEKAETADEEQAARLLGEYLDDPQNWNRFVYVKNRPLNNVDPNGEKVEQVITTDEKKKTGTVTVNASFAFYATGNTTSKQAAKAAATIAKNIENKWKGTFERDGVTYTVKVNVTYQMVGNQAEGMSTGAMNVIGLNDGPVAAGANSQTFSGGPHFADFGTWNIQTATRDSQHEFGHLMNIADRTSGTDMMNTNILQSKSISGTPTKNDLNWAFGNSVRNHRQESRYSTENGPLGTTMIRAGIFGAPRSYKSTRIVRLSQKGGDY